jgi:hypothetical protein
MGLIYGGIPRELALKIRDVCQCDVFIETGTFKGQTTEWAAEQFEKVITIEIESDLFKETSRRLANHQNIEFHLGDSRETLENVLPTLTGSKPLIWLDAHACGDEATDSPLLEEIEIVNRYCPDASVLIDDARFILAPYAGRRLCKLDGLVRAADCSSFKRYLAVIDDVAVMVPLSAQKTVDAYCREVTVSAWEQSQVQLRWRACLRGRFLYQLRKILKDPSV